MIDAPSACWAHAAVLGWTRRTASEWAGSGARTLRGLRADRCLDHVVVTATLSKALGSTG
ncbi:MAG: hypothetical protein ABT15_17550 [Pseudonocardia sp. SCN 73-27]|nr:MAG: hypothetical protein ABS80_04965 [Pseudonocardia sp. SCN 72-51]ODV05306.1 MAG: hypothetical protein ABT15_17550 [Pseudonocardia sp. SCN 73-27]